MFVKFYGVFPFSVILVTIASFIVGIIWNVMFAKLWMRLQDVQK
ncbi:hypothetical protein AB3N59_16020 [Leptospira sp. WS92.C1]